VAELKIQLLSLPNSLRLAESADEVIGAIQELESKEKSLFEDALHHCLRINGTVVESCSLQHERVWMRRVNEPTLAVFFDAVQARQLSSTEDYLWTEGRELVRSQCAEALYDPKPDVAIGLQPLDSSTLFISDRQTWPALSEKALYAMGQYSPLSLIYSPSQRFDVIYPAIIYEAKSDSNPILWAENQAAVGVARTLGLLEDLSRLAQSPTIPPVIAITSAGPMWQVHIAFLSRNGRIVSGRPPRPRPVTLTDLLFS